MDHLIPLTACHAPQTWYCLLQINSHEQNWAPKRPFKFQDCWFSHPGCLKLILEVWVSNTNLKVYEKPKLTRKSLKDWNASEFGYIDQYITTLEEKIQETDSISNERLLTDQELFDRREAQQNLWLCLKIKETFWAQNSRAKWLKQGDKTHKILPHSCLSSKDEKLYNLFTF